MGIVFLRRASRSYDVGDVNLFLCVGASFVVHCPRYRWYIGYVGVDSSCDADCGCKTPSGMGFIDVSRVI